jgi:hypothetical protein
MSRGRAAAALAGVGVLVVVAIGALVATGAIAGNRALGAPHYVEETATAGIDQVFGSDFVYSVGGGVAVFDCDGDGKPDVYLPGGNGPATLYRDVSPVGGALRFSAIHDAATDLDAVNGAYPLDIDGDGITDLAVLRVGESVLLHGLGGCRFERANEAWGFDGGRAQTTAFSATWEGSATMPTLAIGRYLGLDASGAQTSTCDGNELVRPAAGGSGYGPATALAPGYCTLSMLFSDWDRSGRRDLRVSNDRHYDANAQEQLWRVAAGAAPRLYTEADGWVTMRIWGMGIASYDVTGDPYPEVYLTSQGDNKLQTLAAGPTAPTYRDIALDHGVTAAQPFAGGDALPSTAWHPEFDDVNNDGFMDLFVSKGNVSDQPDFAQRDPSNLLLGQPDGVFVEGAEAAGVLSFDRGRGAALADFNLDGLLDLVEVDYGGPTRIWRNVGGGDASSPAPMGHWLALRIEQPAPNPDAIGGWLETRVGGVTTQRELTVGGGHVGGQLGWVHVGLGAATAADVRVLWPDGSAGPWITLAADRFAIITKGATDATAWTPPAD